MPSFGIFLFLLLVVATGLYSIVLIWNYIKTKDLSYVKKLSTILILPGVVIGFSLYSHFPITKERVIGTYEIDNRFYPGKNSDWQKDHFFFEITKGNEFIFNEKLKDGSIKTVRGRVEWYRDKPPMLYRIIMDNEHPLIDPTPVLYRGKRKFYYVFESKFGNMFYRKTEQNSESS